MDYPSPTESSNASSQSPRSTRKRDSTATPQGEDEFDDSPQPRKRASRSTASEKAAKKSARMERNRSKSIHLQLFYRRVTHRFDTTVAAQASRDRKKNHTEFLESRISELEQQLAQSTSSSTSSLPLPTPPTPLSQLPLPPLVDPEVNKLREENASLRTQLELEKMESKGLQLRLASLEGKFGRLEQLFERLGNTNAKVEEVTVAGQERQEVEGVIGGVEVDEKEKDNQRFPARKVSLQRNLSLLSLLPPRHQQLPTTSTSPSPTSTSPSLPQILSSIRILPRSTTRSPSMHRSSIRPSSIKLGRIGLNRSMLNPSSSNRRSRLSTFSSSSAAKSHLQVRLRLCVDRR